MTSKLSSLVTCFIVEEQAQELGAHVCIMRLSPELFPNTVLLTGIADGRIHSMGSFVLISVDSRSSGLFVRLGTCRQELKIRFRRL